MPAIIRHWTSASPVMLAGIVTAAVDQAAEVGHEALRAGVPHVVLDHLVDRRARRRRAARRAACRPPAAAGGSGPTPWIARCSASRTNAAVRLGRELRQPRGADCSPGRRCRSAAPMPRSYGPRLRVEATTRRARARRAAARRVWAFGDPAALRPATTTWSRSAPTSSRGRCWRPTGAGCSRCRRRSPATRWRGSARYGAGVLPLDGLRGLPVAAPVGPATSRSGSTRRARRSIDACADPRRPSGWIDGDIRAAYLAPARARLGALGRGLARRPARRRAVRRGDRRAVRRRVDVPPRPRRLEGRAGRAGRAAARRARRRPAARHAVADAAPGLARAWSRCPGRRTCALPAGVRCQSLPSRVRMTRGWLARSRGADHAARPSQPVLARAGRGLGDLTARRRPGCDDLRDQVRPQARRARHSARTCRMATPRRATRTS